MKEIEIKVTRKKIYAEVAVTTAYLGAKSAPAAPDPGRLFDTLATVEGDRGVLTQFIDDAVTTLAESLRGKVAGVDLSGETVRVTLLAADGYDDKLTPAVESNFRSYLPAAVTAAWLRLTLPVRAPEWEAEATRRAGEISSLLHHRTPPARKRNINDQTDLRK